MGGNQLVVGYNPPWPYYKVRCLKLEAPFQLPHVRYKKMGGTGLAIYICGILVDFEDGFDIGAFLAIHEATIYMDNLFRGAEALRSSL